MRHNNLFIYNNYNEFAKDSVNYVKGNDIIAYVDDIFEVIYYIRLELVWKNLNPLFTKTTEEITPNGFPKGSVIIQNLTNSIIDSVPVTPDADRILSIQNFAINYLNIREVHLENAENIINAKNAFTGCTSLEVVNIGSKKLNDISSIFQNCKTPKLKATIYLDNDSKAAYTYKCIASSEFDELNFITVTEKNDNSNNISTLNVVGGYNTSYLLCVGNKLRYDGQIGAHTEYYSRNNFLSIKEVECYTIYYDFSDICTKIKAKHLYIYFYQHGNYNLSDSIPHAGLEVECDVNNFHILGAIINRLNFNLNTLEKIIEGSAIATDLRYYFGCYIRGMYGDSQSSFPYYKRYSAEYYVIANGLLGSNINLDNLGNTVIEFDANNTYKYLHNYFYIASEVNDALLDKIGGIVFYCFTDDTYTKLADINITKEVEWFMPVYTFDENSKIHPTINNINISKCKHFVGNYDFEFSSDKKTILNIEITEYYSFISQELNIDAENSNIHGTFTSWDNVNLYKYFKNVYITAYTNYCYIRDEYNFIDSNNINIYKEDDAEYLTLYNNLYNVSFLKFDVSHFTKDNIISIEANENERGLYLFTNNNNLNLTINCYSSYYPFINICSKNNPINIYTNVNHIINMSIDDVYTKILSQITTDTLYINCINDSAIVLYKGIYGSRNYIYDFNIVSIVGNNNYILSSYGGYMYDNQKHDSVLQNITSIKTTLESEDVDITVYNNLTSESINSLISNIVINDTSVVHRIRLKRNLYNKIDSTIVNDSINNKNIEFFITDN